MRDLVIQVVVDQLLQVFLDVVEEDQLPVLALIKVVVISLLFISRPSLQRLFLLWVNEYHERKYLWELLRVEEPVSFLLVRSVIYIKDFSIVLQDFFEVNHIAGHVE